MKRHSYSKALLDWVHYKYILLRGCIRKTDGAKNQGSILAAAVARFFKRTISVEELLLLLLMVLA